MKIGILTLPFYINYGGILQCFALQTFLLTRYNADVYIVKVKNDKRNCILKILRRLKDIIQPPKDKGYYGYYNDFITNNFKFINTKQANKLDFLVIGSDQVWRGDFFPKVYKDYFGGFIHNINTKIISYAPSFGINEWLYDKKQTIVIKKLISNFQGISVREEDGVNLIKQNIGVIPKLVLDPTMLLSSIIYDKYFEIAKENNDLFIYWLGNKNQVNELLYKYKNRSTAIYLRDTETLCDIREWVNLIRSSKYIITDSFHGCVFSIIYHKQFSVYINESGGSSRIITLLSNLQLLDRVCDDVTLLDVNNMTIINYKLVDMLLKEQIRGSIEFLDSFIK